MKITDLMALGSSVSKLTLEDDPSSFAPLLEHIGVKDSETISALLHAARAASGNPTETVGAFMQNGGLLRLLSGKTAADGQSEEQVLQCPHCEELIII